MRLDLRLTLTYLLITLVALALLGGGLLLLAQAYITGQAEAELAAQADLYAEFVAELTPDADALPALAPSLVTNAALPPGVTVRMFAANGNLLSDSAGLGPFPSRPVVALAASALPLPISQSPDRRYTARPVTLAGITVGIVELSRSTANETSLLANLRLLVLQVSLATALLIALVSMLVARSIARPIVRLTERAERLASGEAQAQTESDARRVNQAEIAVLAQSLETMAASLQARAAEAEGQRERLASVMASISEGVIALNSRGEVLFSNPASATLLNAPDHAAIAAQLALLKLPLDTGHASEQEVTLGQRDLLIAVKPVLSGATHGGSSHDAERPATVVVLRDVTRVKALEQARTRFFRSISHDLRTPLTTIRGALENMRDSMPSEQQATLIRLENEAARLSRMVDELLHPPASGLLALTERRRLDLGALVEELCGLQQGRTRRAGLRLTCQINATATVVGDRDRLKQAVLNLLDNAITVTPAGGAIVVTVQAGNPSTVQVVVADSGPGVPLSLRERIWERGVRGVDVPTHGGDEVLLPASGAGLGLAIVREIAAAHGGNAWLADTPGSGATFILELPAEIGDTSPIHEA
jgi:signal transduction histidine kinase